MRIGENHRSQLAIGADGGVVVAEAHGEQQPPDGASLTHVLKVRVDDVDGVTVGPHAP